MKISVAGAGYVGLVTGVCLAEMGHQVTCIDIHKEKIELLQTGKSPLYEPKLDPLLKKNLSEGRLTFTLDPERAYSNPEIIFIAVGTPEHPDGSANLEFIGEAAYTIATHIKNDVIICTKSTVPVGTNEKIKSILVSNILPTIKADVVSNSEFLREGSAIGDFFNPDRIIIGGDDSNTTDMIEQIYLPLKVPIIKTDIRSAEMIKYASNAFLATKISFINEIAAICEKTGANIDEVSNGIGLDQRIGRHFLQAGIGYGGSCFPKDTKALVQLAGNHKHPFELLKSVINVNNRQQSLPVKKAKEAIGTLMDKKVAVLGLSFKPNTDDVREAASLTIISELFEEGAWITVYDPIAIPNVKKIFGNSIEYTEDIRLALNKADLAIIATEWGQIKDIPLQEFHFYMNDPIVIDGRNCFPLHEVEKHSITYISIGRPTVTNINKDHMISFENH
ncbi:UDP-glucose dehydrogenase family protein [Peribacillus alkalitolerans]|uniref:UDP-glucose dehydrogenase family protein n=1 Tax=Peribacillus alkalitolerans TaxID=1550385 RepID=UPI0013D7198A|nr:UDP-glucose/GDP-mannose dehydrogenase family protein [Peribacillus alkalitolerans]